MCDFERGRIEGLGLTVAERDETIAVLRRQREALVAVVQRVLDDEESRPGGWGPDVTAVFWLKEALAAAEKAEPSNHQFVDVVFDGPPSHESGRFIECEGPNGHSVRAGTWIDRGDGLWALRIPLGHGQGAERG